MESICLRLPWAFRQPCRPGIRPGLDFFGMADELESMLGCKVDLLTRRSVEQDRNTMRRRLILEGTQEVYVDRQSDSR